VRPGGVLVVCQLGLETALLKAGRLPPNVEIRHFNDIAGENAWNDVALLIVIGRTEPSPRTVEQQARALFGAEVQEIEADAAGAVRYPRTTRGIRMRDGRGIAVEGTHHPDPRVEAVRWAICEAGLVQAIGRGRGVNRTASNPLQIDVLTNVVLPLEVDEVTTWERIQPKSAQVMAAEGAVPLTYSDMAAAYPDLFPSADAARMTLTREAKNPEQTPIEEGDGSAGETPNKRLVAILLGVCSGFSRQRYRRHGARGPAGTLLYDPARIIEPGEWLREHLGEVTLLPPAEGDGRA
jgi:putative DNA primase/helicase